MNVFFLFFILEMCQFCLWKKKAFSSFSPKLTKCWKFCLFHGMEAPTNSFIKKLVCIIQGGFWPVLGGYYKYLWASPGYHPGIPIWSPQGIIMRVMPWLKIELLVLMCVRTGCENRGFFIKKWKFENRVGSDLLPGSGSQDLGAMEN